jgi:hypothetical protein
MSMNHVTMQESFFQTVENLIASSTGLDFQSFNKLFTSFKNTYKIKDFNKAKEFFFFELPNFFRYSNEFTSAQKNAIDKLHEKGRIEVAEMFTGINFKQTLSESNKARNVIMMERVADLCNSFYNSFEPKNDEKEFFGQLLVTMKENKNFFNNLKGLFVNSFSETFSKAMGMSF